jgi:hypothetical protein
MTTEEIESTLAVNVVDRLWRPIAHGQLERRRAGAPATHRLLELPGASRRVAQLMGPIVGLLDDG